jgi:hypothetical protein
MEEKIIFLLMSGMSIFCVSFMIYLFSTCEDWALKILLIIFIFGSILGSSGLWITTLGVFFGG